MATLPFRDVNVHASSSYYAFSSPSSPNSPTLVIERPSGDLRLNDGKLTGGYRVSSISGILGIIKLRLGTMFLEMASLSLLMLTLAQTAMSSLSQSRNQSAD